MSRRSERIRKRQSEHHNAPSVPINQKSPTSKRPRVLSIDPVVVNNTAEQLPSSTSNTPILNISSSLEGLVEWRPDSAWVEECAKVYLLSMNPASLNGIQVVHNAVTGKLPRLMEPLRSIVPHHCFFCLDRHSGNSDSDDVDDGLKALTTDILLWEDYPNALWFYCSKPECVFDARLSSQVWLARQHACALDQSSDVMRNDARIRVPRSDGSTEDNWRACFLIRSQSRKCLALRVVQPQKDLVKAVPVADILRLNPGIKLTPHFSPLYPVATAHAIRQELACLVHAIEPIL